MKTYYVYIMTNRSGTLYIGVTNNLERRVYEQKQKQIPEFTKKYSIDRLVHYEESGDIEEAILREKQLKGWRRSRKIELIESQNATWKDLSEGWFEK